MPFIENHEVNSVAKCLIVAGMISVDGLQRLDSADKY